jgi:hypothetical protein
MEDLFTAKWPTLKCAAGRPRRCVLRVSVLPIVDSFVLRINGLRGSSEIKNDFWGFIMAKHSPTAFVPKRILSVGPIARRIHNGTDESDAVREIDISSAMRGGISGHSAAGDQDLGCLNSVDRAGVQWPPGW